MTPGDFGLPPLRHAAGLVNLVYYLCTVKENSMELKKKIKKDTLAGARYAGDGIALSISGNGDKYMNSIALVECVDGELHLVLFDDAIERYGIKVEHENVAPKVW